MHAGVLGGPSVGDDPNLCGSGSCNMKKNRIVPVVGGLLIVILIVAAAILLRLRCKIQQDIGSNGQNPSSKRQQIPNNRNLLLEPRQLEPRQRQFTYSQLVEITKEFSMMLGKGGFGKVFLGKINNTHVAVKMLSPSSDQVLEQFKAEVEVLLRVHHKNLTALVGYCFEKITKETKMGLIYEYMANGDLRKHLSDAGNKEDILSWKIRLQIATDAAQGLQYMHHGCPQAIVHRDVKCANILLDENFCAKLGDFGLSKFFPTDSVTHVKTKVAGTLGYLDPEYYKTCRLTKKSDVYSFGVVLLEIITGRRAIEGGIHIKEWVNEHAKDDIKNIVDRRLHENFDVNSAREAVEIALACVSPARRPKMIRVVEKLKKCLATEKARNK